MLPFTHRVRGDGSANDARRPRHRGRAARAGPRATQGNRVALRLQWPSWAACGDCQTKGQGLTGFQWSVRAQLKNLPIDRKVLELVMETLKGNFRRDIGKLRATRDAWLPFIPPLLAAIFILCFPRPELGIKLMWSGNALEALGLLVVVLGLMESKKELKAHGPWKIMTFQAKELWRAISEPRNVVFLVPTGTLGLGSSSGAATATVRPPKGPSLEERIKYLEQVVEDLNSRLVKTDRALSEKYKRLSSELEQTQLKSEKALADLEQKVKQVSVGGIVLELAGATWVVIGIALSTWADTIAISRF